MRIVHLYIAICLMEYNHQIKDICLYVNLLVEKEQQEYFTFRQRNGKNINIKILLKILSSKLGQPLSIFAKEKGTTTIAHTNSEAYKDKIDFYLHGIKGNTMTVLKTYLERLKRLYDNPNLNLPYYVPRVSASDVGNLCISESGRIDRTAQNIIAKSKENNKAHTEL